MRDFVQEQGLADDFGHRFLTELQTQMDVSRPRAKFTNHQPASPGRMLSGVRAPLSLAPDLAVPKTLVLALLALAAIPLGLPAQGIGPTVVIDARMAAPTWAVAQRELIQLNLEFTNS